MAFKDLDQYFDPTLVLPIKGKDYVIQPVDADTGLWVQTIFGVAGKAKQTGQVDPEDLESLKLHQGDNKELFPRLLGDTYQELIDDGVDWERIKVVAVTVMIWISTSEEAAEEFWNAGGKTPPKAPTDRKPKKKKKASAK